MLYYGNTKFVWRYIMAKRWTMAEDLIVYKYCVENRWAFSSDTDIEMISKLLKEAGFASRSNIAIKKRASDYDNLISGQHSQYIAGSIRERYEFFKGNQYRDHYERLQAFINQKDCHEKDLTDFDICDLTADNAMHMVHTVKGCPFTQVLAEYIENSEITPKSRIYLDVNMSEDSFSAIKRGKYKEVAKESLFKICFGLRLHLDDAVILMESCGRTFDYSNVLDVVVEYFLRQGPTKKKSYKYKGEEKFCYIYDTDLIDADLYESKAPPLFWGERRGDDKDDNY